MNNDFKSIFTTLLKNVYSCFRYYYKKNIRRRQSHEPFAYITNQAKFYDHDLYVNKNVLIPRPETELMIELILAEVQENKLFFVLV